MGEKVNPVESGGKFEVYHTIKKYINLRNILCLTNIRISTHCLPVERMRKFNIARKDRMCNLCRYKT